MNDIERLLNSTFPFVEQLLKTYGEFYPIASAIKNDNSIAQIGSDDAEDKPLSNKVIAGLKKGLRANQDDYKSIAIYYDVRVSDPNTEQNTDAVSVYMECKDEEAAFLFYFPYVLTKDREIQFSKSWKEETNKEIFDR